MQRLKILAAARALGEFTVAELAAYTGVKVNTARSVLQRERDLFALVDDARAATGTTTRPGRPSRVWRVLDVGAIDHDLRTHDETLRTFGTSDRNTTTGAAAPMLVAERALLRALDEQELKVRSARLVSARSAVALARAEFTTSDYGALRRLAALESLLSLVERWDSPPGDDRDLESAARAVSEMIATSETSIADELYLRLTEWAVAYERLPPVGILLDKDKTADSLLHNLSASEWVPTPLDHVPGATLWAQRWSASLQHSGQLAGIVISGVSDPGGLESRLRYVYDTFHTYAVVLGDLSDFAMVETASQAGAIFAPSLERLALSNTLVSLAQQRRGAARRRPMVQFHSARRPLDVGQPVLAGTGWRGVSEFGSDLEPRAVDSERRRHLPAPVRVVRVHDQLQAEKVYASNPDYLEVKVVFERPYTPIADLSGLVD